MLKEFIIKTVKNDVIQGQKIKENLSQTDPDFIKKRPCLHSRKLFNLIDSEDANDNLEYLEKHLYECSCCQKYYSKLLELKDAMDKNIPTQTIDKRVQESFSIEVREILSNLKIKVSYPVNQSDKIIKKIFSVFNS